MDSGPDTLVPLLECSDAGSSDESAAGEDNRAMVREVIENFRLRRQKGNVDSAPSPKQRPIGSIRMWLMDTGCGHDLVSKKEIQDIERFVHKAQEPIIFNTANGKTACDDAVHMFVKELGEEIDPYVLRSTPCLP